MKFKWMCFWGNIAQWQPKPYIAFFAKGGEPMSRWFYKKTFDDPDSSCYSSTALGTVWSEFFWFIAKPNIVKLKYLFKKFKNWINEN